MFGALPNGMLNEGLTPKIPTAAGTGFGTAPTPPSGLSWLMQDDNAARGKDSGPNGPGVDRGSRCRSNQYYCGENLSSRKYVEEEAVCLRSVNPE